MLITKTFDYTASQYAKNPDANVIGISTDISNIIACLQGRVRFGPGTSGNDGENVYGQWLTITTNAVANTETTFTHSCGVIPVGYLVAWQDKAGSLYQGPTTGTAWTKTAISLKCSVASVQFKLFLLK